MDDLRRSVWTWEPERGEAQELEAAQSILACVLAAKEELQTWDGDADVHERFLTLADDLRAILKQAGPSSASLVPFAALAQALGQRVTTADAGSTELGLMAGGIEVGLDPSGKRPRDR